MVHFITGDTPVYQLSVNQLLDILGKKEPVETAKQVPAEREFVHGLEGLQKLLNCSKSTALKLKQSGKVPCIQVGRKLMFDTGAVLDALNKSPKRHRYAR